MTILDQFSLAGQKAVVTGAGKGIGRGIAICLADAGADVVVASRNQVDLDAVVKEIEARGRRGFAIVTDVSKPEQVAALAQSATEKLGGLTLWVNNAGGQPDMKTRPFVEVSHENFNDQVALNLKSVWAGVVESSKRMVDGGCIVNISSSGTRYGMHNGYSLYAACKAGVNHLTGSLAFELGPKVRVNAVASGPILTDTYLDTQFITKEIAMEQLPHIGLPTGRYGRPEDIAAAVIFFASPASSWITGQTLFVAGGT